ncbi:MAG: 3-hydroxyacyl-CoA dehydrogenase/enoyl-CoA hydratase family protein [Bacteroidetes bacterium]|nr:3-hydroxyacyl-CoA dehydrogenase/enoyl-CoA hydratase family protein [Bacteroidota bacterium]
MKPQIRKVAVLGSGVMGSRIACHFAGIGIPVLLLDIVTPDAKDSSVTERNRLVNTALQNAVKSNPSPVYTRDVVKKITTGNFDDDLQKINTCDWVIEVVVERLDIKKQLYDKVELHRKPGTLITSNTSGIPIHMMAEGRSEDFQHHFCGTHFFNPPRYLRLLEIIPTPKTQQWVVDFLMQYGDLYLGKTTVLCKDTPGFIANRLGIYGVMSLFDTIEKLGLTIDEVDALAGPIIGRPKSAVFRTADVVGIDTLIHVANGLYENCPNDEARESFILPAWLEKLGENKWLGDKTGQGFFKKTKNAAGEKEILTLDLKTMEYGPRKKAKFAALDAAKPIDDLHTRLKMLMAAPDTVGEFYKAFHYHLFAYIANRVPEISDHLYSIDDAMMTGWGWEIGAFESWDLFGVEKCLQEMRKAGHQVAPWVDEMLAKGIKTFFTIKDGKRYAYSPVTKELQSVYAKGQEHAFIVMKNFSSQTVWKNSACRTYHLEDDVLGLEWYTKMGSIGGEVLEGIQKSIGLAEEKYKGLVIANEGNNFSAGANVGMIFMLAIEQEYDEMDMAIRMFQNSIMRARYSAVPVVVAPHALSLGGACELSLHADKVCAAAETYIGLVELGIGVIPGGGGTKEFVLRAADEMHEDEPETITLKNRFISIATAKVATSAHEAYALGILRKGRDEIIMNQSRRISEAKRSVIELYDSGYVMPQQRSDIKVLGRTGLGALYAGIHVMKEGGYATEHDALVAKKLAYVMCGGDLSEPTLVTEQYLLDLEREAFLSLCGEKKTLERIQSVLKSGRPIRN